MPRSRYQMTLMPKKAREPNSWINPKSMLHWLQSLLPHIAHYGHVLVFIVVLLNNLGIPLPGETILFGAGFILGKAAGSL